MKVSILVIMFLTLACDAVEESSYKIDFTNYVNPLIGTSKSTTIASLKHGDGNENNAQVQPSVTMPFAMTNWSAQTQNTEEKCASTYYYKDNEITGFRGSHWLSGSCTQDYGSFSVMPISGKLVCNPWKRGSKYSHDKEVSNPDYYKVELDDYNVTAEMTSTIRSAIFKFTFNNEGDAHIVINPNSDEAEGFVKVIPESKEIVGYNPVHRIYQGWGKPAGFSGYFVLRMEKEINSYGVYSKDEVFTEKLTIENKEDLGAYFSFKVSNGETIKLKIGTSFVSIDEARKNLDAEIPDYNFILVRNNLKKTWNDLLGKIEVEGDSDDDKVKFYTALYHAFQQPRIYNDVSGSYPRFNSHSKTDTIKDGNYYSDFSVWDTYRALHSLYNIIIPEQHEDMVRSLLTKAKIGNWLPIFPCWNSYTSAMIGDHVTSIIAEAYVKGVINLNDEDYEILKKNADETPASYQQYADGKGRRALKSYLEYGYIPLEDSVKEAFHNAEQVSRTLEYAYDDFALAQIAKKMGKEEDHKYYMKRSKNYKNVFDPAVNNMNGRYKDGTFSKEFTRDKRMPFITEGTPWQYNWYVPHDVQGLIELMGDKDAFNADLDKFFEVGQYWHGNEPSHQTPYLYTYSGQSWKTQKVVANTMEEEYGVGPGGLSGNDDAGQMSAWYVFGALGFYPVCPALPEYRICGPKFNKITLKLGNGKQLLIEAANYNKENIFIQDMTFNALKYKDNFLSHELLLDGGTWNFDLSNSPKKKYMTAGTGN